MSDNGGPDALRQAIADENSSGGAELAGSLGDLAINNHQPGARLDAKLAYGFPLGNALLTPYTEVTWEEAASTYGAGLRYGLNPLLELDLKGAHRSRANGSDENRLLLELRSHL